jgi:predicted short-subunit dehydrogenase-like oxidoreductase (DUF2520 family)
VKSLNIIGAGKVGKTLAHLWHANDVFLIQDIVSSSKASAQIACEFIGNGTAVSSIDEMRDADVWMISVQDAHIAEVTLDLAQRAANSQKSQHIPPIVFHCSGAISSEILAPLAAQNWMCASAHCVLSFSSAVTAVNQFRGTNCALEGNAGALALLKHAFERIDAQCFGIDGAQKLIYHAAAVFATNFLPVLQAVAEDAWRSSGVPEPIIQGLRASLLQNAVANIVRSGPQQALTGPAARGDVAAIAKQSAAVSAWDAQAGAAYDALSALALRMATTK